MKQALRFLQGVGVACLGLMLSGCISVDLDALLFPQIKEITVDPGEGLFPPKIALIDISGVISGTPSGGLGGKHCTPDSVRAVLDRIEEDARVKAIVLRIDTPGGSVSASDMIFHEIKRFRSNSGLPVFAMIMGMGCSGGYYIANAAEKIYAHPTSITGSIGVIATFLKFQELGRKVGVDLTVVKSGEMKDMGNPMREMTPAEREVFSRMIGDFYGQFLDVIIGGREAFSSRDQLLTLADGRIFTAQQAAAARLIDDVGYLDQAIAVAEKTAGIENAAIVTYGCYPSEDATIYSPAERSSSAVSMPSINVNLMPTIGVDGPGFYYLWLPGH